MSRPRFGSIYQRTKKLPDGTVVTLSHWWIKYRKNGQVFRESSGNDSFQDAERLLKRRNGEIVTGKFAGLGPERIRMAQLFDDVIQDYKDTERATLDDAKMRVRKHLLPAFGEIRAAEFGTRHVKQYKTMRQRDRATNATINRELALVRRAFNLAAQADPPRVARVPHIKALKENNVRTGFLEYEQYLQLRDALPWYVRPICVVAYHVGPRRGELTCIRWPQVDFEARQIRLNPGETKNDEPRTLPIYGEMLHWLVMAKEIRDQKFPDCPWVFYNDEGQRIQSFYKTWASARERAGVPGLLFHDLRRAAVRNMERASVPRKVAMAISGHKTESVYRRYDIVASRDLADAAVRMDRYLETQNHAQTGTLSGTPEKEKEITCSEVLRNLVN